MTNDKRLWINIDQDYPSPVVTNVSDFDEDVDDSKEKREREHENVAQRRQAHVFVL